MNLISAGENPASSDNICPNCECALSAEWPDLSQRTEWSFRKTKDYLKASDLGCSLCSMVVAILRDAREKQCTVEPQSSSCAMKILQRNGYFLMTLNDSKLAWKGRDYVVVYKAGEPVPLPP